MLVYLLINFWPKSIGQLELIMMLGQIIGIIILGMRDACLQKGRPINTTNYGYWFALSWQ
ncbi:hypothetical protein CW304_32590 [Bacillus sp. UFRGS-B20]|nr:hypothetical protein CW304_32590 [Bacillus sp. UFRGS-B20]